jgi:hypothetical protein
MITNHTPSGPPQTTAQPLILGSTGATGSGAFATGIGGNTDHVRPNASLPAHAINAASVIPSSAHIRDTVARACPNVAIVSSWGGVWPKCHLSPRCRMRNTASRQAAIRKLRMARKIFIMQCSYNPHAAHRSARRGPPSHVRTYVRE